MGTHRKSHEGRLKKTLAAGAIAGAAVGFGALAAAPSAFADNNDNEGWWLGSGNANNNNTIIGQVGSGNANEFGNFNGNIMNNQLNALSPVIGGTAVQANTTRQSTTPVNLQCSDLRPQRRCRGNTGQRRYDDRSLRAPSAGLWPAPSGAVHRLPTPAADPHSDQYPGQHDNRWNRHPRRADPEQRQSGRASGQQQHGWIDQCDRRSSQWRRLLHGAAEIRMRPTPRCPARVPRRLSTAPRPATVATPARAARRTTQSPTTPATPNPRLLAATTPPTVRATTRRTTAEMAARTASATTTTTTDRS